MKAIALRAEGLMPFPFAFDHVGCIARDDSDAPIPLARVPLKGAPHDAAASTP